jgi:ornithine carbamoyltransferase
MGDMMTIAEHFGDPAGKTIVFVGDGNNVARSLAWACAKLGVNFVNVCPDGYQLEAELIERLRSDAPGLQIRCTSVPSEALGRADVLYTDTWVSMGQEQQREQRSRDFAQYQVNRELLELAPPRAVVMHCMPAHRGLEITSEVLDSPRSIALDQAENRLHFQRALLEVLLAKRGSGQR